MTITVSNVSIAFPKGTTLPSDADMTVTCDITGLAKGSEPSMYFPAASMATKMKSQGGDSWSASDKQTYGTGKQSMTIEGVGVTFDLAKDGTASNIKVG